MSNVHQLLCLAKSWKKKGYCIAGKNDNNQWIRLVTDNPNNNAIFGQGDSVSPLNYFTVTTLSHSPQGHQTENYIVDKNKEFVVNGTLQVADLKQYVDTPDSLWGTGISSYYGLNDKVIIDDNIPVNSLYLIEPDDTIFIQMQNEYETEKLRLRFSYNGEEYLLTTTDMRLQEYFRQEDNKLDDEDEEELENIKYLTISLAEPLNGNLYKVVAGVF
ncbi:hypothetical protein ACBQ54_05970 [Providencia vermicola]|uniref:dual OB domain-containing protein n=1 Tax=Providencia vermicola TaxID=333965 RepID=UPI003524336E